MLEAETMVDRRRLRRRLTLWRIAAVVLGPAAHRRADLGGQRMVGPGRLPAPYRPPIGLRHHHRRPKMHELFDKLAKSDQVKAVIIDINSPGGTTTGGEAMYDAIRRLAEKKPVVAVCGTLATSAAYIAAVATDRIFVYGNTITGSVGVIFQWADVTELMQTLGIKVEEVKSGPLKAVPSPFEPTDEKGRALAEEMVQEAKVWFVDLVAKRRQIEPATVPGLTDGRIYSGRQALALKLVDDDRRREGGQALAAEGAQNRPGTFHRRVEAEDREQRHSELAVWLDCLRFWRHRARGCYPCSAKSRQDSSLTVWFPFGNLWVS